MDILITLHIIRHLQQTQHTQMLLNHRLAGNMTYLHFFSRWATMSALTFIRTILQIPVMRLLETSFCVFSCSIRKYTTCFHGNILCQKSPTGNSVRTGTIKDRCQSHRFLWVSVSFRFVSIRATCFLIHSGYTSASEGGYNSYFSLTHDTVEHTIVSSILSMCVWILSALLPP